MFLLNLFEPDLLLNSHFSFCPKSCTSTSTVTSKRVSGASKDYEPFNNGTKFVTFNFNPTVKVFRSVKKVPLVSLFNDFGSSMGLWLGISVFSIYDMAKNMALDIMVEEKLKLVAKLVVIMVSLFPIGVGCIFIYLS